VTTANPSKTDLPVSFPRRVHRYLIHWFSKLRGFRRGAILLLWLYSGLITAICGHNWSRVVGVVLLLLLAATYIFLAYCYCDNIAHQSDGPNADTTPRRYLDRYVACARPARPQLLAMQRRIRQDFARVWRAMRLCGIAFVVSLPAVGVILYVNGQHDPMQILARMAILAVAMVPLFLLIAFVVSGFGTKWFLTDEGFNRVTIDGTRITIPWEQIYHLADTDRGFFIRWREPVDPGENVSEEYLEHQGILYPAKADADELIALWQQKTSRELRSEGQTHLRSVVSGTSRRLQNYGLAMIVIGVALIGWGAIDIARYFSSASWPSVEGRIVSQQYRLLPPHPRHSWREAQLKLVYEYNVAGETHRSERYSLWQQTYSGEARAMRAFANEHPADAPIRVYYNPKNPAEAVLLPGPDWRGNAALFVGGLFLVALGLLVRNALLKLGRKQPNYQGLNAPIAAPTARIGRRSARPWRSRPSTLPTPPSAPPPPPTSTAHARPPPSPTFRFPNDDRP
jgi:hypothetical protein